MKYDELSSNEKKEILKIIEVFKLPELTLLDKVDAGERVADILNHMGQDGDLFVNHIYDVVSKEDPIAEINPRRYMICRFIGMLAKLSLKQYGRDKNDVDGFFELSMDVYELAAGQSFYF
jgi:hypothetical protein